MADEFELSILDSGDQTRAIAVARFGYDMAIVSLGNLQLQALIDFHARLSAAAAGRAPVRPSATELEEFGKQLFALLVQGDIETIYDKLPPSYIRLQIYSNRPDLQAIPWEYIQWPRSPPGPDAFRSVIRVIPTIGVSAPVPRKLNGQIRLLFVYAEPPRGPSVGWSFIKDTVEKQFKNQPQLQKNFTIEVVEGATRASFEQAFVDAQYDILHIVCHGQVANGIGSLVFQDIKGSGQDLVSAPKLGGFLKDKELGLVVLSACNTSAGDYSKEFATVAKTLVESGIPAVIANQFEIQNSVAAAFAGAFYRELLISGDVDRATTKGRSSLDFRGELPNSDARIDWGIPTLYRHLGGAKVFQT